jgi:hypothetical protein
MGREGPSGISNEQTILGTVCTSVEKEVGDKICAKINKAVDHSVCSRLIKQLLKRRDTL